MPCSRTRTPTFPCPKCGAPINPSLNTQYYIGTSEPDERGERFRFYHCLNCGTLIKRPLT